MEKLFERRRKREVLSRNGVGNRASTVEGGELGDEDGGFLVLEGED